MEPVDPDQITTDTFDQAVEALVFASDVPLRAEDLVRAYGDVTGAEHAPEEADDAVSRLNAAYQASSRAFRIHAWGGGYRMATVEPMAPFVQSLFARENERRMSRSLLETLAVVAYKQPVTKPEVDHVRGVSSDYALRQLLDRGFVQIDGRSDSVGRPLLYTTTDLFLDQFGLASLEALPQPREIEEILADPTFNRERARLLAELGTSTASEDAAPTPQSDSDGEAS
ncbi:MAG: SMC-Scp complex subunit ScpB [Rubricoccaceae bacterium]